MNDWDLLTKRDNLAHVAVQPANHDQALEPGEVRLCIELFALTANNITYGVVGDRLGYWQFFPAPDGYGRIPAWGFATVEESRADDVEPGLRLYGYWPMSTRLVTRLQRTRGGAIDVSPHRASLAAAYNSYAVAAPAPGDAHRALLGPLFMTSFLIDDYLLANEDFGARAAILASASSKTALGLASLLKARGLAVVGLTSARNRDFVDGTGYYSQVLTYDEVEGLASDMAAVYVDFAGDASLRLAVHTRLADTLRASAIIGSTHHTAVPDRRPLPGPAPAFFFAPDRIRVRLEDWGPGEYNRRTSAALTSFVDDAGWLDLKHLTGPDALVEAYAEVFAGLSDPAEGLIVHPR